MDDALDSHFDLDSRDTYSPASKCSSALPHQPSRSPRHDQYEICRLSKQAAELFCDWCNGPEQFEYKKWEIFEIPRETHIDMVIHSNQLYFHLKSGGALAFCDPSTSVETECEDEKLVDSFLSCHVITE